MEQKQGAQFLSLEDENVVGLSANALLRQIISSFLLPNAQAFHIRYQDSPQSKAAKTNMLK